ncbi:nucleoside-diphosphate-sugar epimerase [Exophiala viscosa]|uniref:Nucleoside-diphosphate-sugar epimerase n=1 Tax=Exophiala viscosa TaxID=2486360 RepID=A0AAN6IHC4_9EURO|nr:nucleoside-diphosphate-sugar epimerase [Exophiala viscosa]KAI1626620.1 nucleoside-diphosphate-sugar epimerase [Exophiala viscosa]
MKVLITGAGGFLGQFLARELLSNPEHKVVLTDIVDVPVPKGARNPHNATCIKGDLLKDRSVVTPDLDAVYIFHGIMSSGSEANYDLGMSVNLESTRLLLETIRQVRPGLRVIYASSQAVYGRPLPDVITESVLPTPEGSYGAAKFMCETLINDMNRKGFIDAFVLRFPTISVRPGKPAPAASAFISGIIREPLEGKECIVPVKDRHFPSNVCNPKTLIWNLVYALTLKSDALPKHKRVLNSPGICVTIQEMMDALAKVGGEDKLQYIKEEHDEFQARILYSWAYNYDNSLALSLGFKKPENFEEAVKEYIEYMEEQKKLK